MKVKYLGNMQDPMSLMKGHIYECLGYEKSWEGGSTFARIVDEEDEDYLYPAEWFEEVKE